MTIVIGIILILAGFVLVWKTHPIVDFAGHSEWAESHLGAAGGTYLLVKLIGLLAIFFGLLAVTGLYQGFLEGTVGALLAPQGPGAP